MKSSCNIVSGQFCGAEIEPGTFHQENPKSVSAPSRESESWTQGKPAQQVRSPQAPIDQLVDRREPVPLQLRR
jgi:hypothetical protein